MKMKKVFSKIIACAIVAVITIMGLISPEIKNLVSNLIVNAEKSSNTISYYDIYGNLLDDSLYIDSVRMRGKVDSYSLCDYDSDGIDELVVFLDSGTGNIGLFTQMYDYQNGKVIMTGEIGGTFVHLNSWYLASDGNGIVIAGYLTPSYLYYSWTSGNTLSTLTVINESELSGDEVLSQIESTQEMYCGKELDIHSASDINILTEVFFEYNDDASEESEMSSAEYSDVQEYLLGNDAMKVVFYSKEGISDKIYASVYINEELSNLSDLECPPDSNGEYHYYVDVTGYGVLITNSWGTTHAYTYDPLSKTFSVIPDGQDKKSKKFIVNHTEFLAQLTAEENEDGCVLLTIYKVQEDGSLIATNLAGIPVGQALCGDSHVTVLRNAGSYFAVCNDKLILNVPHCEFGYIYDPVVVDEIFKSYCYDEANNLFIEADNSSNEADGFTIEIPYEYFVVVDSVTGEEITKPGANKSMVNAEVTECTNGIVKSMNTGCDVCSLDRYLESITVENVKPGKLTIDGTCQSYTSIYEDHGNAGYTCFGNAGDGIEDLFTLTVIVDENGSYTAEGEPNENYDTYYITSHQENKLEDAGLWYSSYDKAPSNNELYTISKLLYFDINAGALHSNIMLDKQVDIFNFNFGNLDKCPFDTKTYYGLILAQLLADSYDNERFLSACSDALIDILNEAFAQTDDTKMVSDIAMLLGVANNGMGAVSLEENILKKLGNIDDFGKISKIIDGLSKITSFADFFITFSFAEEYNKYKDSVNLCIAYTVWFKAFLQVSEPIKVAFGLMHQNANDKDLQELLNAFIGVLETKDVDAYIQNLVDAHKSDAKKEAWSDGFWKGFGYVCDYVLNKVIEGNPYGWIWIGIKIAVNIENAVVDKFMETDKYYATVASFIACNRIHETLYKSYNNYCGTLYEPYSMSDADTIHTILQFYTSVDIMSTEAGVYYIKYFVKNNGIMNGASVIIQYIFENYVSEILCCEKRDVFTELIQLFYRIENLSEKYAYNSCCETEEEWLQAIASRKYWDYYKGQIENTIDSLKNLGSEDIVKWYEKKKSELNEWYQCAMDVILIACPVTVNVYDAEGNLIAVLSDNGVETSSYYNRFFITCNETEDEITENKSIDSYDVLETKAKILLLPHESSDFRYEIIGDTDGKMDVYTYEIESINAENWFDQNRQKISCQNIPIREKEIFAVEKAGSRLVLKNLTSGEVYESIDSNSTNFVLIVIIGGVIVAAAVTIVTVITVLVRRKKKYSSNSTVHNTSQHRFKYCRKCGEPAKYESSYCKKCGTQFIK